MAKRDYNSWDQSKIDKFIKEGRGHGEGKNYKPWLTIQDFPSLGRATRVFGWKSQRIHHFFTDSETRCFYLFEWNDEVIDVREHFPLLYIDEVIEDKEDLNFDAFKDKNSGVNYILSTTFLLTIKGKDKGKKYVARSVKAASEISKKISLEKFEIERRYWESKKIDWGIITPKEISVIKARNIEWVHSSLYSFKERGLSEDNMAFLCSSFIERLDDSDEAIRNFIERFDNKYNLDSGTGLYIFKYLIASKIISVDMEKAIDITESLSNITINQN